MVFQVDWWTFISWGSVGGGGSYDESVPNGILQILFIIISTITIIIHYSIEMTMYVVDVNVAVVLVIMSLVKH